MSTVCRLKDINDTQRFEEISWTKIKNSISTSALGQWGCSITPDDKCPKHHLHKLNTRQNFIALMKTTNRQ